VSSASSAVSSRGVAVEFQQLDKRYGVLFALRGVSLAFRAGECVALLGHNGSGKTTLLKIAALLARPTAGQVRFSGDGLAESGDTIAIRRRLGLVAHNTLLYDELTAEENLTLFAKLYGLDRAQERAVAALGPAGLARRGKSAVRTFSRGMRQRLAIARAMLPEPGLLLLDEPTTGLDAAGQQWFAELIDGLNRKGCTIVMSTHAATEAHEVVTRAVRLGAGEVQEDSGAGGDPRGLLAAALAMRQEN
jgi:ABC-type multidrug transport system ATPase subunit